MLEEKSKDQQSSINQGSPDISFSMISLKLTWTQDQNVIISIYAKKKLYEHLNYFLWSVKFKDTWDIYIIIIS